MTPLCTRMYTHPFFEATPPGAAPGPPVKTGARVRHFRGCNQISARELRPHCKWGGGEGAGFPQDFRMALRPRNYSRTASIYLGRSCVRHPNSSYGRGASPLSELPPTSPVRDTWACSGIPYSMHGTCGALENLTKSFTE